FALRDPDFSDPTGQSNGFESDNDGSSSSTDQPYTKPTLCNFTLCGPERTNALVGAWFGTYEYSAVLRRSTQTSIYNSVIMGYPWGLSIRDATTQGFASGDSLQIRNTHVQATTLPSGSTSIHDQTRWAGVNTWFTTGSFNNVGSAVAQPSSVGLTDMSDLTNPDPRPAGGSPLIGTADYSNPRLAGLVVTNYKGAFDPNLPMSDQWTYYWTNFDPQNTDYSMGAPTGVAGGPSIRESLSQNYPNPFNPQTSIDFVVPTTGNVTLEVFDVSGARVRTLFDGVKTAGSRTTLSFNADGLASGVYFYRLKGNGFTEMRKMVLLK
ncbi:MAG: T9SS type A sorting domain-containing protein, partial [Polyangiales bacterium]